ncbi:MAG: prepilin peptidase [Pseudomonadota bacterium]
MLIFNIVFVVIFGLCFGSFITMASYRFADQNISLRDFIFRNSFCPSCNNQLKFQHLVPVFSWLFCKGKCGFCKTKISLRYPLIEIATALLFLTIFFTLGAKFDVKLILILLMAVVLMIMVVVDLEHYFIPNFTQIILAILALAYHLILPNQNGIAYYILSASGFLFFGLVLDYGFFFFTKKQGIGEDDLKFFAVAGLTLGIDQLLIFMIINGVLGTIFGVIWTRFKKDNSFPFAPALAVAFLSCILFKINYIEDLGMLLYLFQKYITRTAY